MTIYEVFPIEEWIGYSFTKSGEVVIAVMEKSKRYFLNFEQLTNPLFPESRLLREGEREREREYKAHPTLSWLLPFYGSVVCLEKELVQSSARVNQKAHIIHVSRKRLLNSLKKAKKMWKL